MTEADRQRYADAAHGMQSGVRLKMTRDGVKDDVELWPGETAPKHLRVGVNTAMSDHGALVRLLIDKNLITEDEYSKALADAMEHERDSYKEMLGLPDSVNLR